GLTAAIVTVEGDEPAILVAGDGGKNEPRAGLPSGPFDPLAHRTFEIGLRAWVEAQTGLAVGYVEQLYTFGDRGRHAVPDDTGPRGGGWASAPAACPGTRRRCSIATSCSTTRAWSRRRAATVARRRLPASRFPRLARPCGSTTAASSAPRSRGCAPSSNTDRW